MGNEVIASKAATDEGVEEALCGLLTSLRIWSLDVDSLLFLRDPFLVLVGITTGLVVDWGVSILGGMAALAALSFLGTFSTTVAGIFSVSLGFVEVVEEEDL